MTDSGNCTTLSKANFQQCCSNSKDWAQNKCIDFVSDMQHTQYMEQVRRHGNEFSTGGTGSKHLSNTYEEDMEQQLMEQQHKDHKRMEHLEHQLQDHHQQPMERKGCEKIEENNYMQCCFGSGEKKQQCEAYVKNLFNQSVGQQMTEVVKQHLGSHESLRNVV